MSAMVLTVRPLVAHSVHVRARKHAHTYTDLIYAYKQAQTPTRTHSVIFTFLCCCICYSTMCLFIISLSAVVDIKFCVLVETILHGRAYKATHFPNSLKLLALYPYRKACRRRCDTRPSRSRCRCRGRWGCRARSGHTHVSARESRLHTSECMYSTVSMATNCRELFVIRAKVSCQSWTILSAWN